MSQKLFALALAAAGLAVLFAVRLVGNEYLYFAGFIVLQYVVIATAWNILGGYTGYINFGSAGFLAAGTYTTIVLYKLVPSIPLPIMMACAGLVAGLIGLLTGYATLRVKGIFFSIATLAFSIVLQALVVNWSFVGGSRGIYVLRPQTTPLMDNYVQYLFLLMLVLSLLSLLMARGIERSKLGRGFTAIRDDETAAEACGVPTLKLKLIAAGLSGGLLGMAGAPLPYYLTYVEPSAAFSLSYAVNSLAMPLIGGMSHWAGPLIGALLLATSQQAASVTISSAVNLLVVGVLLVGFVVLAPKGIVGLFPSRRPQ